ncbi:MAG: hypothetical protein AAB037_02575, partial [Chloroflexota bacterium]
MAGVDIAAGEFSMDLFAWFTACALNHIGQGCPSYQEGASLPNRRPGSRATCRSGLTMFCYVLGRRDTSTTTTTITTAATTMPTTSPHGNEGGGDGG